MEQWSNGVIETVTPRQYSITPALHATITVGIITISDRASAGEYEDLGGPALKEAAQKNGLAGSLRSDRSRRRSAHSGNDSLVFSARLRLDSDHWRNRIAPRDVTPEAIRAIMRVELPGFGEVMRAESMKITPNAILSRSLAAIVDLSLVIALPGKPSGAVECLGFVAGAIPHGGRARTTHADFVLMPLAKRPIDSTNLGDVDMQRSAQPSALFSRAKSESHQLPAVFAEICLCAAAGDVIMREIAKNQPGLLLVTQLRLRHVFFAWFYFQRQARTREGNFPRGLSRFGSRLPASKDKASAIRNATI